MQNMSDTELIDAYVSRQDESVGAARREAAFAELVRRHGTLVYRACHRLLKDHHEARDASQAVFVILARKAGGLRKGELAAWLYRVAHHVAAETVRKRMRRSDREQVYAWNEAIQMDVSTCDEGADPAVLELVDAALLSLPERYREAVILRYLQNHSQEEAARLAGCPLGTLSRRASEGLAKLRQRLSKRGVALSGVALAGLLTSEASAAVPEALLPSILAAVKTAVATTATATTATSTAAMLAKGAMKAMFIAKVKMVAAVVAAVIVTGTAVPVGIAVAQAIGKDEAPKTNTASVVDDATAMYLRAVEQMRAKDYKAAIQTLESFLQTYPDAKTIRPEALYWLGDCYTKAGDPAAAKRVLEKANSEFPDSNWGKYARGRLSADNGFITLSPRPDYEVPDYPTNSLPEAEATLQGEADKHFAKKAPHEYELAADAYNSFVVKYPKSKAVPYALVREGRSLQLVGKRSEAIKSFSGVLEYYPGSIPYAAPALLYLAQCHYLDGKAKEATKAIAQLRADKDYGKHEAAACATFLLAHMQAEGGKTDEAIATLGTIAVPFPAYAALAQLRQAEAYEKAGRTAEAVAAYRATMTKYPGTPESDLAHSALEKMGSRSPDADHVPHVPLAGKAAELEKKAQEAKVTLSIKEMTADNALDMLSMRSGITIRKTDIPKDAKISLEMRDASVLDGVKRVTEMLGLTYVIVDDAIEVSGKKKE